MDWYNGIACAKEEGEKIGETRGRAEGEKLKALATARVMLIKNFQLN